MEETGKEVRQINGEIGEQSTGAKGKSGGSSNTSDTGTRTKRTRTKRTGDKGEKELLEVAPVDGIPSPDPVQIVVPEPPKPQQKKPRKVTKKKNTAPDTSQIDSLLLSVSALVASRPGLEHWSMTEKEVKSITAPLMGVLEEYEILDKVSQNSNQIALAVACFSVFTPRVIVTVQKKREENKRVREVKRKVEPPKGDNKESDNRDDKRTPGTGTEHDNHVPFYGNALS